MSQIVEYYIIGCCLLTWIGISYWAIKNMKEAWRYLFFSRGLATITQLGSSTIDTISRDFGTDGPVTMTIKFSYKFKVDEIWFSGSSGKDPYDNSTLNEKLNKRLNSENLKIGDEIKVFYDPKNPKLNSNQRFHIVFPMLLLGLGQLFLVVSINLINDWFLS